VHHRRTAAKTHQPEIPLMPESFALPKRPEDVIPSLVERFNSRNLDAMMELYSPEAVVVATDGRLMTDRSEFAAVFQRDMNLGVPLKAHVRHVFVGGDTAQIILDWAIDGTDADGKPVHVHGTASDIMRRGADGVWRYIIDNNQGTAVRQAA
jgi:ketosteroid isomerase-like protein